MKMIGKKVMTGTLAAAFLLGGAGLLGTQAYAAASAENGTVQNTVNQDANASTNQKPGLPGKWQGDRGSRGGANLAQETATLLGVDLSTVTAGLQQGKTLAEIAQANGLAEEDFLQKLADVKTKSIDAALSSGQITQEQADKQKSGLTDRLKQRVENTKPQGDLGGRGHFGPFGDPAAISKILGITEEELNTGLSAGKSLAEIAEGAGISEDQLIADIKEQVTGQIKSFVESKGGAQHGFGGPAAPSQGQDSASSAK